VIHPELEPDRGAISPQGAEAWGVDIEARYDLSSGLATTLRYSYMDVDDRISDTSEGTWVPRRWSQRHTVNAIVAWTRNDYTLAAALTWHTGWRTTVPPRTIGIDETLPIEQVLNNTELRDYLSFDVSASKSWTVGRSTVTVFADITNALDRNNVAGIDYDLEEEDGSFIFEPDRETLFPLIPLVGVAISF
jgi:outer membrane receptor for ferrienterochelin and colicin